MKFQIRENTLVNIEYDDRTETVLRVPDGVVRVDLKDVLQYRLEDLPPIKEIHIPRSVRSITSSCFSFFGDSYGLETTFPSLEKVFFHGSLEQWCAMERGSWNSFFVGDGLEHFGLFCLDEHGAFYEVRSVVFKRKMQRVEHGAFYGCTSLTSVVFCGSADIGARAFLECPNLKTLRVYGPSLELCEENDADSREWNFPLPEETDFVLQISEEIAEKLYFEESYLLKTDIMVELLSGEDLPDLTELLQYLEEADRNALWLPEHWDELSLTERYRTLVEAERDRETASEDEDADGSALSGYEFFDADERGLLIDRRRIDHDDLDFLEDLIDAEEGDFS